MLLVLLWSLSSLEQLERASPDPEQGRENTREQKRRRRGERCDGYVVSGSRQRVAAALHWPQLRGEEEYAARAPAADGTGRGSMVWHGMDGRRNHQLR